MDNQLLKVEAIEPPGKCEITFNRYVPLTAEFGEPFGYWCWRTGLRNGTFCEVNLSRQGRPIRIVLVTLPSIRSTPMPPVKSRRIGEPKFEVAWPAENPPIHDDPDDAHVAFADGGVLVTWTGFDEFDEAVSVGRFSFLMRNERFAAFSVCDVSRAKIRELERSIAQIT